MTTAQANYDRLIDDLKQVVNGSRGWASLTDARLTTCGLNRGSASVVVRALGLRAARHGRYGWTATK